MAKPTSTTKQQGGVPFLSGLFNIKPGYVTTITNGRKTVTAGGNTPKESQKNASRKWR